MDGWIIGWFFGWVDGKGGWMMLCGFPVLDG